MGKRPRTPHFITGIGDGNVNHKVSHKKPILSDELFQNAAGSGGKTNIERRDRLIRTRNERLMRLEEPLTATTAQWRDVFGSGDPDLEKAAIVSGIMPVSAFAILGMIVIISAIFLHMLSESSSQATPRYRRRQRQRRVYKTRKKTDEWSDDEEPIQNSLKLLTHTAGSAEGTTEKEELYPHYYHQPTTHIGSVYSSQESRQRRTSYIEPQTPPRMSGVYTGASMYYAPQQGVIPSHLTPGGVHRRGISPKASYTSSSQGPSPVRRALYPMEAPNSSFSSGGGASPGNYFVSPSGEKKRVLNPLDANDLFHSSSHSRKSGLPRPAGTGARNDDIGGSVVRPLHTDFSSFESLTREDKTYEGPHSFSSHEQVDYLGSSSRSIDFTSQHDSQSGVAIISGRFYEETPLIDNMKRKTIDVGKCGTPGLDAALLPPLGSTTPEGKGQKILPFIPSLNATQQRTIDEDFLVLRPGAPVPPPRSMPLDDLRLVQMETGNSEHWGVKSERMEANLRQEENLCESEASFYEDKVPSEHNNEENSTGGDSNISIPSGDPRKSIIHKRKNLTMSTDAATSLQSDINFEELKLVEVIGGGGFGQVWRASWRGTPVAVKVLIGGAQNTYIAKAILEEFKAEINLLKGMRHPNICLYMGACVDPPNRAIVTELAANGSVWDALRLPLMRPYVPSDGISRGSWPLRLYMPDEHGTPPRGRHGSSRISAPILPKGAWPWELVKRVACGAARGMAYLHSGNPPVLHRDLKSANLLLDESYTAKVCDFGLSRLKAQERSMTGNCGTVQWMAPEVLANMSYNEKADVYSFGIIIWELLSRECPYDGMSAIQCALAVLNRDKRPEIPKWCPPCLHSLIKSCVKKEPDQRPSFVQIILALDAME